MTDWLCSIHPRHWRAIADGTKRFELRRRVPGIAPGDRVYVCVTGERGRIAGSFAVRAVMRRETFAALWLEVSDAVPSCTEDEARAYFAGCRTPNAIAIDDVQLGGGSTPRPPQGIIRYCRE